LLKLAKYYHYYLLHHHQYYTIAHNISNYNWIWN